MYPQNTSMFDYTVPPGHCMISHCGCIYTCFHVLSKKNDSPYLGICRKVPTKVVPLQLVFIHEKH